MHTTDEIKAVADVYGAIACGMVAVSSSEVAMARLQQLEDAVRAIYPDCVEWFCFLDQYLEVRS